MCWNAPRCCMDRSGADPASDLRFDMPGAPGRQGPGPDGRRPHAARRWSAQHIERVLRQEKGKVEPAARRLGIPRSSLYQKLKQFQIAVPKD